jgi:3-methyl-2-oxobutanoate hydroxymethyltransferase
LVTPAVLQQRKQDGEKIAMITAYDYPSAVLINESPIDTVLVGDSLGMAVMGLKNTLSVTMDIMVHHTAMVSRGLTSKLVVGDLPFMSYQACPKEAVHNAGRLIAEGGAQAVKMEGSAEKHGEAIRRMVNAGIPVMGHLGLTPQSVLALGGFKVQGREAEAQDRIFEEAKGLEEAGCFAMVLECMPPELGKRITEALYIPTIGIGAGADCDGQVLVFHDIFGWGKARFARTYFDVKTPMAEAFKQYAEEVKSGAYPSKENTY